MNDALLVRFCAKIELEPAFGCWLWQGALNRGGYGRIQLGGDGSRVHAHRASYELFVGPIPEGLDVDHLCRVRRCVNPDHLDPVTRRENLIRGDTFERNLGKTRCPGGHEYTEENTYLWRGHRHCRACNCEKRRETVSEHEHVHEVITTTIDEEIDDDTTGDVSGGPTPIGDGAAAAVGLNPDGTPAPPDATGSDDQAVNTDNGPTAADPPQDGVSQDPTPEAPAEPAPAPPAADPAPAPPDPTTAPTDATAATTTDAPVSPTPADTSTASSDGGATSAPDASASTPTPADPQAPVDTSAAPPAPSDPPAAS